MAVPRKITNAAQAADALAGYAAWRGELFAVAYARRFAALSKASGEHVPRWLAEESLAGELPPRPPRLAALDPVDRDKPPVAYFGGRRVVSFRPLQASIRPRWDVRDPLSTGDNGVRVHRPGVALAAVLADLDQLGRVVSASRSLASTCRAAGMTDRGDVWHGEADETAAFATRHGEDTIPTLGDAFLAEWRAHEGRYALPTTPATRPTVRPVSLRA